MTISQNPARTANQTAATAGAATAAIQETAVTARTALIAPASPTPASPTPASPTRAVSGRFPRQRRRSPPSRRIQRHPRQRNPSRLNFRPPRSVRRRRKRHSPRSPRTKTIRRADRVTAAASTPASSLQGGGMARDDAARTRRAPRSRRGRGTCRRLTTGGARPLTRRRRRSCRRPGTRSSPTRCRSNTRRRRPPSRGADRETPRSRLTASGIPRGSWRSQGRPPVRGRVPTPSPTWHAPAR